jgi:4,5-dihydroxyphthalate decarboxylase
MAQKLNITFWNYDRMRLLADGSVKIEGADGAFHSARIVPEIFEAMVRRSAFDEESRSRFWRPVFPVRAFSENR